MLKKMMLIGVLATMLPICATAQTSDHKYEVGIRSALMVGTMDLSQLDPAFDDLSPDGATGAHMSGFYLLMKVRPHLRLGVETLVSNSDKTATTTMNYQAAGPVVELSYGRSWYVSGSVNAGGLIVNAMSRSGAAPAEGASQGSFFKGEGLYVAPSIDVGYRYRRLSLGVFLKQVSVFGEAERGGMSEFGSRFGGMKFSFGL